MCHETEKEHVSREYKAITKFKQMFARRFALTGPLVFEHVQDQRRSFRETRTCDRRNASEQICCHKSSSVFDTATQSNNLQAKEAISKATSALHNVCPALLILYFTACPLPKRAGVPLHLANTYDPAPASRIWVTRVYCDW